MGIDRLEPVLVEAGRIERRAATTLGARQARLAWILLLPTLAVLVGVALYPLVTTFYNSLTDARLGSSRSVQFVGLENYRWLLTDPVFLEAVGNTLYFTVVSVSAELVLGLLIALVIHSQFPGRGLVRAAVLVPWAIPTVVSAQMWRWMYNDVFGVVNDLLMRVGLLDAPLAWTAVPGLAMHAIIAVDVWKTTPFMALLLLAGLQVIPRDLYEAARVDGASQMRQFFSITLPLLRPAMLVALIFRTLDALRVFDVIFVMTAGASGTESMATYNRRVLIEFQQLGYGSAVSVVIFFVIFVFVLLYVRLLRGNEA
ncbi:MULTISPECIES: carbohydrate ABC transporter permease [Limnochorda]|uniref:carbohydrate ABC transporter permease n=1 Tax=Limnochorda TaxID=1676651 RepID=UPI001D85C0B7|nr:sugar ABC transporter permease [Limnochorda pilosa]MBO2487021.1 ABC transporter permease [Bacillota bacterium]MBO2518446.1 ABC transporter permease [Bacillota bacterium]